MTEPTLRNLFEALSRLEREQTELSSKIDIVLAEVRTVAAKVDAVSARVDTHRADTAKRFSALDRELTPAPAPARLVRRR